jgi:N-acetylglucosamine malate deacetylase 1
MKNVMIIGAHFDDVELGVGGTAAKLVKQGCKVYKLVLTDNKTDFKEKNIKVDYQSSKSASLKASSLLGMTEISDKEFAPIECNKLEYSTEIMQRIEALLYKYSIDTVFIHYTEDMNHDHIEASKLCLTAARHCQNIIYFQSNAYLTLSPFTPTYFVDITDFMDLKKKALSYYPTEHDRFGRLFSTNYERDHTYGFLNGTEYCEGFVPVKIVE